MFFYFFLIEGRPLEKGHSRTASRTSLGSFGGSLESLNYQQQRDLHSSISSHSNLGPESGEFRFSQ